MPGMYDSVRPYQLPDNAQSSSVVEVYNLNAKPPIYITPGQNGQAPINVPPIQTGQGSDSQTITYYCPQSMVEIGQDQTG